MRKRDEVADPESCLNKARDGEMLFILLGRDESTPATIRWWIGERIRRGKNQPGDAKLLEAERCARAIEMQDVTPGQAG